MTSSTYATLDPIFDPLFSDKKITLNILRLDTYIPTGLSQATGNKYFKLKHNIEYARARGFKKILSFGGAFSNHIHALALVGREIGLSTVGIIRGESSASLNPTLADASAAGMHLSFVTRSEYRRRYDKDYLAQLSNQYPDTYIIPEGGSNDLAVKGCGEILSHVRYGIGDKFDRLFLPCATAATMAGVVSSLSPHQHVTGVSVLKGAKFLNTDLEKFLQPYNVEKQQNWEISHDYHGGGYAKFSQELADFVRE